MFTIGYHLESADILCETCSFFSGLFQNFYFDFSFSWLFPYFLHRFVVKFRWLVVQKRWLAVKTNWLVVQINWLAVFTDSDIVQPIVLNIVFVYILYRSLVFRIHIFTLFLQC